MYKKKEGNAGAPCAPAAHPVVFVVVLGGQEGWPSAYGCYLKASQNGNRRGGVGDWQ
jgi:hypothetical protein